MTKSLGRVAVLLGLSTVLLVTAYLLINTTFMIYDDEGYVLLTYKNFIAGGRLYDEIFTQYGPWPYVYHLAVNFVLQTPITHMVGRNLTAIHWVLCSLLAGAVSAKLTGEKIYAVFATLVTFGLLWRMSNEPSHPGSLICALLAGATLLIINTHGSKRWNLLGGTIGLFAGLLVLTKINIGVLFIAGAGVAALRLTHWPQQWQRTASILSTVGLLLVPWGLMGSNLREPWVLILAIQFTFSAAGLLWVSPRTRIQPQIPPQTWFVSVAVFIFTFLCISAAVCVRGTSFPALLQAVFVDPLRLPASFMLSFTWRPSVWPVSIASWLLIARTGWELRYRENLGFTTRLALLTARLVTVLAFIFNLKTWLTLDGVTGFMIYGLPLLPVFLVSLQTPDASQSKHMDSPRFWVVCLALPQVLHAYPVAGSQMGWGTFLLVPAMVMGLHDAWAYLAELLPGTGRWLPRMARTTLLLVGCVQLGLLLYTGWNRYQTSKPLDLPGAENIRAGDRTRLVLRVLTLNSMVHADVLFSRQGMFSYNLWSGVPTPTGKNATHWFWLLDYSAQAEIIDRLRQTPRSVVITNQPLDEALISYHVPMACPLQSFIEEHYRPLFVLQGFHFLVPESSHAAPFAHVDVFYPARESAAQAPALFQTNVVLDGQLVSAQLQQINAPWQIREKFSPQNARLILQPITARGDHWGESITLPHTGPLRGLFQLSIYASRTAKLSDENNLMLVGLDEEGRSLFESAF